MPTLTHCQPRKPVRRPGATRVVTEAEMADRRAARLFAARLAAACQQAPAPSGLRLVSGSAS